MNAEIMRIRKNKNLEPMMEDKPTRINPDDMTNRIYTLNENMAYLYGVTGNSDDSIDKYIEKITQNIYIILNIFSDMNVYPDYFYDTVAKIGAEYRNYLALDGKVPTDSEITQKINNSPKIFDMIRNGMNYEKYRMDRSGSKDISECFVEMVSFFQKDNLKYNDKTIESRQKAFDSIKISMHNIIGNLSNSDDIYEEILCLSMALFKYIRFFTIIGVNPKPYLDQEIEKQSELGKSK